LARATGEWVLTLDADECVTPELRDEIDAVIADPKARCNVYRLPWRTYFCGKPLRFGRFSVPQARLFRREGARYRDLQVHESLLVPQRLDGVLSGALEHHSWRDYRHAQEKHLLYAQLLAEQKHRQGKRGSVTYATLRFMSDFLVHYFGRLCLLDGRRGFLVSIIVAQYAFHKYAALAMLNERDAVTANGREPTRRADGRTLRSAAQ
jgi:hypothetical protein